MEKLIIFLLVCIVCFSCHTKNKEEAEAPQQKTQDVSENTPHLNGSPSYYSSKQERGVQYYHNLMESFKETGHSTELTRPEYYGGSYIDDDGNFVILVKANPPLNYRKELEDRVKGKDFILKPTDVSYVELYKLMETINAYWQANREHNDIARNILSTALDEKNSRISVGLDNFTSQSVQEFKDNMMDSPHIYFEQGYIIKTE